MANKDHVLGWDEKHPQSHTLQIYWDLFVPKSGASPTPEGEVIRAISRLVYEWCNNGNCNAADHKTDYCDSCGGSGYEEDGWDEEDECANMRDCGWCGGECMVPAGTEVSSYYAEMLDHIERHVPDIEDEVEAVRALITGDKNYDENENVIYNAMTEKALTWVASRQEEIKQGFEDWKNGDDVVKTGDDEYTTQCTQYGKTFSLEELKDYYYKEFVRE